MQLRRLTSALVLVLLVLLGFATLHAQFRLRVKRPIAISRVSISFPTAAPTLSVTAATILLSGTAAPGTTGVTWANDRGGSGTAVWDGSSGAWTIETAAAAATIFQDPFTDPLADTELSAHAPSIGTSWVKVISAPGTPTARQSAQGYVEPTAVYASATTLAYLATPSPALTGVNYDLSALRESQRSRSALNG